LAPAARAELLVVGLVVVRRVPLPETKGEVLQLLAVAARGVGGRQAAERRGGRRAGGAGAGLHDRLAPGALLHRDARRPRPPALPGIAVDLLEQEDLLLRLDEHRAAG